MVKKKTAHKAKSKLKKEAPEPKAEAATATSAAAVPAAEAAPAYVPSFLGKGLKTGAEKEAEANPAQSPTPSQAAAEVSQQTVPIQKDQFPVQNEPVAEAAPAEQAVIKPLDAAAPSAAESAEPATLPTDATETEEADAPKEDEKPEGEEGSFSFSNLMNSRKGQASVQIVKTEGDEEESDEERISDIGKKKKIKPFYIIVGLLFVLILVALVYLLYSRNNQATSGSQQSERSALSDLITLPAEDTILATITDAAELSKISPEVFATANNQDKLFIFVQSKRVLVFRAASKKIITFTQLDNLSSLAGNTGISISNPELLDLIKDDQPSEAETLTIQIRNGTSASGITLDLQKQIESLGAKFVVEKRTSAATTTFEETTIFNLAGDDKADLVQQLADALHLKVEIKLPEGESGSDSNIVIIVGADKL